MSLFVDLYKLKEDDRIQMIGETAYKASGRIISFTTDSSLDDYDKSDRYVRKLLERFPNIEIVEKKNDFPVPNTMTVKIRKKV